MHSPEVFRPNLRRRQHLTQMRKSQARPRLHKSAQVRRPAENCRLETGRLNRLLKPEAAAERTGNLEPKY